jgi:hypothetical protein
MRIVGEIPHPSCKITLFSWNGKYIIKLERGMIEQTFKVSEMDVSGDDDIQKILSEAFMQKAIVRFDEMEDALMKTLEEI